MIDKFTRYGFLASTIIIAVLLYMYNRQGQKLATTIYNLQKKTIEDKLHAAKEKAENDKKNFKKRLDYYNKLKLRYADDIKRLGARVPAVPKRPKSHLEIV